MKEILIPLNLTNTPAVYDTKQSFSSSDEASGVLTFTTTADVAGTVASLTIRNASENANRQTVLVDRLDVNSSPFSYALKNPLPFGQYEGTVLLKKNLTVIASVTFLFGVNSSLSAEVLPDLVKAYSLDELVENVETEVSYLKDAFNLTVSETVKGVNKTESRFQAQENVRYLNEHTRKTNEQARIAAELDRKVTFDALVDSEVIEQEVAEKYQEVEETYANRLFSTERQLEQSLAMQSGLLDFKGSDTTVNIHAKTGMVQGDYWWSTDGLSYLAYTGTTWADVGSSLKELADIRVRADGYTETTAANAVKAIATGQGIANSAIALHKLKGVTFTQNLINTNYTNEVLGSDGSKAASGTYQLTDFIPVEAFNYYYRLNPATVALVGQYDSNHTWISRVSLSAGVDRYMPPIGCAYIKLNEPTGVLASQVLSLIKPTEFIPYNPGSYQFGANFSSMSDVVLEDIKTALMDNIIGLDNLKGVSILQNLIKEPFTNQVIGADGSVANTSTWRLSDFIPVTVKPYYRLDTTAKNLIGFYDANKVWISRISQAIGVSSFTPPANTAFIKLNEPSTQMAAQVLSEFPPTEFVPYNTDELAFTEEFEQLITVQHYPKLYGKKWLFMGDSITAGAGASVIGISNYVARIAQKTGLVATNVGVGGSRIQYVESIDVATPSIYTKSTQIDFTQYDIVTIFAGTNDILNNVGTPTDTVNTTACGALNLIIQNILTNNPLIKIGFITPMYRDRMSSGDGLNSDDNAWEGKWVIDLCDKLQQTAEKNHIPCLNLYRKCMVGKHNADSYLSDGLHPNDNGHDWLSDIIVAFVDTQVAWENSL